MSVAVDFVLEYYSHLERPDCRAKGGKEGEYKVLKVVVILGSLVTVVSVEEVVRECERAL